jgi:hypothetical protein
MEMEAAFAITTTSGARILKLAAVQMELFKE